MAEYYDLIIGVDLGHCETTADTLKGAGAYGAKTISLDLDENKNRECPTVILYAPDRVFIGRAAGGKPGSIAYFKAQPGLWDKSVSGHAKKQMMSDFLGELMGQMRRYNPDLFQSADKIMLLVGCPTSKSWLQPPERQQAYERLIQRATKATCVRVVPESRAALFTAFQMLTLAENTQAVTTKKIQTLNGAVVFDFGSSTADFTYMQLGKYLIERSWMLGASEIEKGMLRQILAENGLSMADVHPQEIGALTYRMREQKEKYYSDGGGDPYIIQISKLDENGDPIVTEKNGKQVTEKTSISYVLDDELMERVLNNTVFEVSENDVSLGKNSWPQHCERFFTAMKQLLDARSLPYENIILTGGASRMAFIRGLCESVFEKKVFVEANPSHSVSKGLCFLANAEQKMDEIYSSSYARVIHEADSTFESMLAQVAQDMSNEVFATIVRTLTELSKSGDTTVGIIKEKIETAIQKDLGEEVVSQKVKIAYVDWIGRCKAIIVNAANDATTQIFPDPISANCFRLSNDVNLIQIDKVMLNLEKVFQMDGAALASTALNVVASVIESVLVIVASCIHILLGIATWLACELSKEKIMENENRKISADTLKKIIGKFAQKNTKEQKDLTVEIRDRLRGAFQKELGEDNEKMKEILGRLVQSALNIVALREFEHCD